MADRKPVFLALSLDVEEEGLFSGRYQRERPPVTNTRELVRLAPLLERGVKPTLFCAYSVLDDARSRKILAGLRDNHGAEIGAHLHHWNTPPLVAENRAGIATKYVGIGQMRTKMSSLFKLASEFQGAPVTSFRMGRWDLLEPHWQLLHENGVLCDASVRPLHRAADGPDHFNAPRDPYLAGEIMEMPLTVTPLFSHLGAPLFNMPDKLRDKYQKNLKNWGALALLPVEHPLWLMKLTTSLHLGRGGSTLSLTWHSSEMMAGGSPRMPSERSVNKFMQKMEQYLDWLMGAYRVTFTTISQLRDNLYTTLKTGSPTGPCDWSA